MTDSSQTRVAYIAESTYGVTPTTPVFKNLRVTGESMAPNIANVVSNELRADRNIPDLVQVGSEAGGNLNFELSYGSFDDLLEGLMFSTWSSNVLKNGVTRKSFTVEKTFEAGATDQYHRFHGAMVNTMELNIRAREIVTGTFGLMAKGMTSDQAIITDATYTAVNGNPVINAASNFASLAIEGVTSPEVMAISLRATNNLRQDPVVGSIESKGIGSGRFQVTGTITAYFENEELYELFLAGTASGLSFTLGGASALNYTFNIPNMKFDSAQIVAGGNDQPVMAEMSFTAIYDSGEACALKITRDPS